MNLIQKWLYLLDFFKEPFLLLFQKKRMVSTLSGAFFSLMIIGVLFYFFITSNMVNRTNPFVIDQVKTSLSSHLLNLSPENFEIAVGVTDFMGSGFYDPSIFNIKIAQISLNFNITTNSKYIQDLEYKETIVCNSEAFSDPETFDDLSLANFTCLQNGTFELVGGLDEKSAKMIVVYIAYCDNNTDNITCQSQSNITQFFNEKGLWFYYRDYYYDMNQGGYPIKNSWELVTIRTAGVVRNSNLYLRKLEFVNDNTVVLTGDSDNYYSFIKDVYEFSGNQMIMVNNPLISINIYSSKNEQYGYRQYQTFGQLMAMIGGLISLLMIIGKFVTDFFIRLKMQNIITKELFSFHRTEGGNEKLSTKIVKEQLTEERKNNLTENPIKTTREEKKIEPKTHSEFSFNTFEYLKMLIKMFFRRTLNQDELSYILSEAKSDKTTDIVNILKKIKEFEKLKMIVLTEEQEKIFGLLAHTVISIDNEEKENEVENTEGENYLENLYDKLANKPESSSIDLNFMKLIEKKLLKQGKKIN